MSQSKIPATIITGFLGAGKTTLIRNAIGNAGGKRIAVIVNEFGDLGFDGDLIKSCMDPDCADHDVMELTNGCICCTVADDFLPVMERLLSRGEPIDHIIIETSGLALPQPLLQAFSWPTIKPDVTVDGVITLADAVALSEGRHAHDEDAVQARREADESLDHDSPVEELFEDQIACADLVVLTKSDLLDAEALAKVGADLREKLKPNVEIIHGRADGLPFDRIFGIEAAAENDQHHREAPNHHHHHDDHHHDNDDHTHHHHEHEHGHDEFESFVLIVDEFATADAGRAHAEELLAIPGVMRVKGHMRIAGKNAPLVVQGVGSRVETWFERGGPENGSLVVIGLQGIRDRIGQPAVAAE